MKNKFLIKKIKILLWSKSNARVNSMKYT